MGRETTIINIVGGPFVKFDIFRYSPDLPKKRCSGPDGPRKLVFITVRARDAYFGRFNRSPKYFKNHSVSAGFASKIHANFGVVWEGEPEKILEMEI